MSDFFWHKDIWYDILLRLPVKTLVICACTCKTLNSYITNPDFIACHLNKSKENPLIFLRYHAKTQEYKGDQLFGLHPDDESLNWDFNMRKLPLKTHAPFLRILGSINGVICLSDDLHGYINVIYLWNPSINKHIQLPYPNISFAKYGAYDMFLGFGFNELANDFKVVRIVYLDNDEDYYTQLPLVEVYSVKSRSWRYVENLGPKRFLFDSKYSQCYLKDVIHWLGHTNLGWSFLKDRIDIVTFNVPDESFGLMKLPASLDLSCSVDNNFTITTCQGKLALIHLYSANPSGSQAYKNSRIWIMNEYGVVDSWTPVFILNDREMRPLFKMITFRKNEDMIMLIDCDTLIEHHHSILSCNAKTGVAKELGNFSGSLGGFYLALYEESLALFAEGKSTFDNIIEDNDAVDNDIAANDAENFDAEDN